MKVSIIIPAYNIENYIGRCIESCINQTVHEIEIIVINDGSTDNTLKQINKFKDDRIIIIDQKNAGSMEARKSGLKIAEGEYILFVDGDDYISLNTVEVLYNKAINKNYDIVCHDFFIKDVNGNLKDPWINVNKVNLNKDFLENLFESRVSHNMWSKLIKRNFIKDNKIDLPSGFSYGEDLAFIYTLAMYNPKFMIIDTPLYYYCKREGSLDSNINEKTCEITQALKFVKKQLLKTNLYEKYKEEFEYMCFMENYYIRKDYIFKNRNKISRELYKGWKSLKVNININNNRFYRNMYEKDPMKARILEEIFKTNYTMGYLYYKIKGI